MITKVANLGVSPKNSAKLLKLLLDETQVCHIKIQLSAYVEVLSDLRHLCTFLEGDDTDLPLHTGGCLERFTDLYSNGEMKELPSTNQLIMWAIDWAVNTEVFTPTGENDPVPINRSTSEITKQAQEEVRVNRPRRQAAISYVRNAVRAGETAAQCTHREQLEAAQQAALKA